MRNIDVYKDPFGAGFSLTKASKISIESGLTVLVGCNGAGKTTMLNNIEDELQKADVPVFRYSELEVRGVIRDNALMHGDMTFVAQSALSSEGENISLNLGKHLPQMKYFIETGKPSAKAKGTIMSNERWILLDAVDSGFSIDNILEFKNIFDLMSETAKSVDAVLYIVASANAYEFANGEDCIDIFSGEHIRFSSYDEYREFILKTRELKKERYENR